VTATERMPYFPPAKPHARKVCTCAGTSPGFPQHEEFCGLPEREAPPERYSAAELAQLDQIEQEARANAVRLGVTPWWES
jgi:hypothetical protein